MPPSKLFLASSAAVTLSWRIATSPVSRWSMTWRFCSLFVLQCSLWVVYVWLVYPNLVSPLRRLPGPKGGSFLMAQFYHTVATSQRGNSQRIREWVETTPNDGLIRYLDVFNGERILVTNPKALAEVLVHKTYDFIKPPQFIKGLGRILGVGVFLAEGQEHKAQRKNLMPAFAFRHIKDLYPTFWSKSRELMIALAKESESISSSVEVDERASRNVIDEANGRVSKASIDVNDWASRATLDIIGVAGLGRDFHALEDPNNRLLQVYKRLFSPSRSQQILLLLGLFLPSWFVRSIPIKRNGDIEAASTTIKSTCRDLIQQAEQKLADGKGEENILSVALNSGGFSDENLVNQLMTFLIAGHETTASALAWAVCMLCKHPDVQATLREEIRAALPDPRNPTSTVSSSDLDNLPYLNAVCNEVLRLWPPVALTLRVAARDTTILGQYIPKHTTIFIVPWAINTSTALWGADAGDFAPDRWLAAGKANSGGAESNYAFLTFLHGPRSCIGQSFARAEFACLLAAWAWTFETRFTDERYEVQVRNGITAKPRDLRVEIKAVGD